MIGTDELVSRIKELSDEEKVRLVDAILTDLNTRVRRLIASGLMKHESDGQLTSHHGERPLTILRAGV